MKRVAVFLSGRGSNMVALVQACKEGRAEAKVALVVSNDKSAPGLEKAKNLGITTEVVARADFPSKAEQEHRMVELLRAWHIEGVCLAGFMQIVGPTLLNACPNRILNIHPSLLPAFPGLKPQAQALAYGVKVSGCTVHFVDEGVDSGPTIIQAAVPVLDDDTEEALSSRILKKEHEIYPIALDWFAKGLLELEGRRVTLKGGNVFKGLPPEGFWWPGLAG
jgi:phosphoribosylglycinamide formyltransferase-1